MTREISFTTAALLAFVCVPAGVLGVLAAGNSIAKHFEHQDCLQRNAGYSFVASMCAERVYGED